jgi:hypothetical protein
MSHNRRESSTRLQGSSPPGGLRTRKVKADRLASTSYCTMRFSVPGVIDRRSQQVDSAIIGLESWSTAEAQYRDSAVVQPRRPEELVEVVVYVHMQSSTRKEQRQAIQVHFDSTICCRERGRRHVKTEWEGGEEMSQQAVRKQRQKRKIFQSAKASNIHCTSTCAVHDAVGTSEDADPSTGVQYYLHTCLCEGCVAVTTSTSQQKPCLPCDTTKNQ